MSQYKATHCQAPNFAYALTVRKLKSQRAIKVEDLDLSSVRHMFNAVRLTRRVVACACVCVSVVCVCVSVSLFVCVCVRGGHTRLSCAATSTWDAYYVIAWQAEPIDPRAVQLFLATFGPAGFKPEAMSPGYGLAEHTVYVCDKGAQVLAVDKQALEEDGTVRVLAAGRVTDDVVCTPNSGDGAAANDYTHLVGCGFPARNHDVDVIIVDTKSFRVLGEDRVGEIWINSPSKAVGYYGLPEKSAADFHALPSTGDGEAEKVEEAGPDTDTPTPNTSDSGGGYLRSGDLGFLHNGELFICGRSKDLIIIRGRNHYPQDIEHTVEADTQVCGSVLVHVCVCVCARLRRGGVCLWCAAVPACCLTRSRRCTSTDPRWLHVHLQRWER